MNRVVRKTMHPSILAALYDGGVPFLGGIYAGLLGFRVIDNEDFSCEW